MKTEKDGNEFACVLRKTADIILDMVFPEGIYCIGCGALIDRTRPYSLCDRCREKFHFATGKTCEICGRVLSDDYPHRQCTECMKGEKHIFDKGYTCMMYGLYEKKMIRAFKYKNRAYYKRPLGEMMYDRIAQETGPDLGYGNGGFDMIVPVPMNRKKRALRGYDQAQLLAGEIAERSGVPFAEAIIRTVNTVPMSRLTREERMTNLMSADSNGKKSVFEVTGRYADKIRGKRILLIDDIYTTGSTADACSLVLKEGGARDITLLTLAAGGNISL